MSHRFALKLVGAYLVLMGLHGAAFAQPGGGGASSADAGDIVGESPVATDKIKSWVSRTADQATAVCVFRDPNDLMFANIRQYSIAADTYASAKTKIVVDGTSAPVELDTVLVRLKPKLDDLDRILYYEMLFHPNGYNPNGSGKAPAILVGYARYYRGKNGRDSSDVVFRYTSKFKRVNEVITPAPAGGVTTPATPAGAATAKDPCDTPPIDDLGEEEEIPTAGPSIPGPALPLTAVQVPDISVP